jgi:hypothetical protein
MYLLSDCTDARGYFPINTKWGGTSTLSGLLPGGGLRGMASLAAMSYFRPNFAMARGNYPGAPGPGGTLGELEVDPGILAVGIGALALGMFLLGGKHGPRLRKRKAARLRRRLAQLEA